MDVLEYALRYLERGFSVIPIRPKDKKPLTQWKEFQTRLPTKDELKTWFEFTDNNIGIVTGKISNLDVIDCDTQEAAVLARKLGMPEGLAVETGRGMHFYCSHRAGATNFQKRDDLPGIDLRAEGGFVVAPPSIHSTGKIYRFIQGAKNIPPLPDWILGRIGTDEKASFSDMYKGAQEGNRNDWLARLAGKWVSIFSLEEAIEMGRTWNLRNDPPMKDADVVNTVKSIYQTHSKNHPGESLENAVLKPRTFLKRVLDRHKAGYDRGISPGWQTLEPNYRVRLGEWTLVTGIPGHGKSTFLDHMVVNLIAKREWKFAVFSAENFPHERYLSGLCEQYTGVPFSGYQKMTEKDVEICIDRLDRHIFLLWPEIPSFDVLMKLANDLCEKEKINGLVIDPWNELRHFPRPDGMTETEYILSCLNQLRRFVREKNIHAWVVVHPAKLVRGRDGKYPVPTAYDAHGSVHWRNQADNILCVWRDVTSESHTNEIHIQKIRFREAGMIGMVELRYDTFTGRYLDKVENPPEHWTNKGD